ncbi:MAG: VWA domain-containing protein [Pseudomonadota bacterium]
MPWIQRVLFICLALLVAALAACSHEPVTRDPDSPPAEAGRTEQEIAEPIADAEGDTPSLSVPVPAKPVAKQEALRERSQDEIVVTGAMLSRNVIAMPPAPVVNRENYAHFEDNPLRLAAEDPVSTFSIDVDTGAYANVRRLLRSGQLPPRDAVRAEELINYFDYDYRAPRSASTPFSVTREVAPAPWAKDKWLMHIGVKGYVPDVLPQANLVFLLDVSGSMNSADKLGLLKSSLKLLVRQLDAEDSVAIVVYAGASGVVLKPTPGDRNAEIIAALDRLQAGGSTNGGAGIRLAYAMAEQAFIDGGINRVILATDGDFNVGTTNIEMLKDLVAEKREAGIALTTLGFGTGNYNDHLMEQIADVGNGNYAYIDTLNEAQKVLVDELTATTLTIAKDVKIQVEFNPAVVAEYRLVGYENRALKREDFNNDKVDAGEIGAGHTVTAIYELAFVEGSSRRIDPLRYGKTENARGNVDEIAFLRMRYKSPKGGASKLLEWPVMRDDALASLSRASEAFRFSAAVAAFAQQLRGGDHLGDFGYGDITALANSARGKDAFGYRGEFVSLVNLTRGLSTPVPVAQGGRD